MSTMRKIAPKMIRITVPAPPELLEELSELLFRLLALRVLPELALFRLLALPELSELFLLE